MMVKAKIQKSDDIVVEVAMTQTVRDWKVIRDALKRGIDLSFHGTAQDFKNEIAAIVAAIEETVEPAEPQKGA